MRLPWGSEVPHPYISQVLLDESAIVNEALDWLMSKITLDDTQGCWALPLLAEHDSKGRARYPTLTNKIFDAKGELAHRFVIRRLLGSLATDEHLDHLCRVHACCNPMHLEVVTHATNVRRGRIARNVSDGQYHLIAWKY